MMQKATSPHTGDLITVEEAAQRLNITANAIYKLISAKKLEGIVKHFFGRTNVDWPKLMERMDAGGLNPKKRVKKKASEAERRVDLHESLRDVEVATMEPDFQIN
jgi:excisionase family DNA binding protein